MFRPRLRVLITPAITLGVALVAVAACSTGGTPTAVGSGGSQPTTASLPAPAKLLDTVKTAALAASAVHVKGSFTDSGTPVNIDMQLNKDGSAQGTIGENGTTVPLVLTNKVYYIQFSPGLMASAGLSPDTDPGKELLNKWVPSTSKLVSGSDMVSGLQPATDYNTFIPGLFNQMSQAGSDVPKASGTSTVDGTTVEVYKFNDGSEADVTTSSPHYLIRLVEPPSQGKGELDLTGWDKPVAVTPPPASEIYNGPGA